MIRCSLGPLTKQLTYLRHHSCFRRRQLIARHCFLSQKAANVDAVSQLVAQC